MKTGNTPGWPDGMLSYVRPQWSPVMKTGNTWSRRKERYPPDRLNGARS